MELGQAARQSCTKHCCGASGRDGNKTRPVAWTAIDRPSPISAIVGKLMSLNENARCPWVSSSGRKTSCTLRAACPVPASPGFGIPPFGAVAATPSTGLDKNIALQMSGSSLLQAGDPLIIGWKWRKAERSHAAVIELASSHAVYISHPAEVAALIEKAAQ